MGCFKALPSAARFPRFEASQASILPWGKNRSVIIYSRFDPLDLIRDSHYALRMTNWMPCKADFQSVSAKITVIVSWDKWTATSPAAQFNPLDFMQDYHTPQSLKQLEHRDIPASSRSYRGTRST